MTKKLSLNRETLRRLDGSRIRTVVGGASQYCDTNVSIDCPDTDYCVEHSGTTGTAGSARVTCDRPNCLSEPIEVTCVGC
jgi:hypothetical protein